MWNMLIVNADAGRFRDHLAPLFPEVSISAAETSDEAGDAFAEAQIIVIIGPHLRDGDIEKAARLEWIQALTTGVDNILASPFLREEALVTTTRGIHGPQMSELAVLLMLSLNRDFPRTLRRQGRKIWDQRPQRLLEGKTAAILGVGAIGEQIARKSKAFGMRVIGISGAPREVEGIDEFYRRADLLPAAREADFLIVLVPHSPATDKIVGAEVLAAMKPTAFLINIARGGVVDEAALIGALERGEIAGAGLDVFAEEPLPAESPLWGMENVIVTPHIGGMSENYVEQVMPIVEENLRRFTRGEREKMINIAQR
ncbi:MAG: D-2-hydroxyacid dehydrogenase [bacterium]